MFDFSTYIDLPLIWGILVATAILLYVLLDGFDLGIGIIFPFAPSEKCRNRMMSSVAPFWDGNETWLILGGGGLFAAFPLAYSILMPALYMPIIMMLLSLIMRGIAFEFRFKAESSASRKLWDYVFHFGSLGAAFCQGVILGALIIGVKTEGQNYSGGPFDWATGFSMMTGVALVFGYALLGSTWLIMKTEDITQSWARKVASYVLGFVGIFMAIVSICVPFIDDRIKDFWFSMPNIFYLLPIPLITAGLFILTWIDLSKEKAEIRPFLSCLSIFFLGYIGLGLSIFPWIVPFKFTLWEAAAANTSLSILLIGYIPGLPVVLGYTAYCYYVFRGKTNSEHTYY